VPAHPPSPCPCPWKISKWRVSTSSNPPGPLATVPLEYRYLHTPSQCQRSITRTKTSLVYLPWQSLTRSRVVLSKIELTNDPGEGLRDVARIDCCAICGSERARDGPPGLRQRSRDSAFTNRARKPYGIIFQLREFEDNQESYPTSHHRITHAYLLERSDATRCLQEIKVGSPALFINVQCQFSSGNNRKQANTRL
jgi:hypothetical protein